MDEATIKELLREKGMCGRVTDGHACILSRGHDDGVHDKGWTVAKRLERPAYSRDSRDADDVFYDVKESAPAYGHPVKIFTTENKAHAEWLASTLTRLDL